jgi:serine/threonine protein phosphatase PrpC
MEEEVVLEVAAKTNVGRIRELNEDNFIVTNNIGGTDWFLPQAPYTNPVTGTVMVVADGMGGMNAGEVASKIAVDGARKYFNALSSSPVKTGRAGPILKDAILFAHQGIVSHALSHPETEGMGTTMVACWIVGDKVHVAWSGDSRCYCFNPVTGLRQLSKDHSYVQSLVDEGKISAEQAFDHPQNNIVLQSLGDANIRPEPDVVTIRAEKDDLILLCSDGLSGMLTDPEIEAIIRETTGGDIGQTVTTLIEKANAAGGTDNITVILVKVLENTMAPGPTVEQEEFKAGDTLEGDGRRGSRKMPFLLTLLVIGLGLAIIALVFWRRAPTPQTKIIVRKDTARKQHAIADSTLHKLMKEDSTLRKGPNEQNGHKNQQLPGNQNPGAPIPGDNGGQKAPASGSKKPANGGKQPHQPQPAMIPV